MIKNLLSSIGKEGFTSDENFEEMKDNFEVPTVSKSITKFKCNRE